MGTNITRSEKTIRAQIALLEGAVREAPQMEFSLKHTFTEGVYCREIFIPAGSVIVGKIHKHEHINFISKGRVTVLTKDGLQDLEGPCTMVSSKGTKRALYAHEDTVWTTIHANPTNETDLSKLEDTIISKSYEALDRETVEQIGHLAGAVA